MDSQVIKLLFLRAIKPKRANYVIVHSTSKAFAETPKGRNYQILCEGPSKPLPFTLAEIENLDNLQIIELETMIELRRRKRAIEKQKTVYDKLFASIIKRS
ncbi:hypothetical protein [Flavobacterium sp. LB3P21]|uniref:hypothetical protein n=1 Tax=unclassified Flavobacterium TaxID=196869 RepID=UPI003AAD47CF